MYIPFFGEVLFRYEWVMLISIPLAILLLWMINKDFVRTNHLDNRNRVKARNRKIFFFFSRLIIILLLLAALAYPYKIEEKRTEGNPRIALLLDSSYSMSIYDTDFAESMKAELSEQIPTTIKMIGEGNSSRISDGIYSSIDTRNIVLITDGYNLGGKDLGDTLMFSMSQNVSLTTIMLKPMSKEISVSIEGPSKVVEGVENDYIIKIDRVETKSVKLTIEIDGVKDIDTSTYESEILLKKTFSEGSHKIVARVEGEDTIEENNIFYKTINVIEKPKILYIAKKTSGMSTLMDKIYDVQKSTTIPSKQELDKYLAVVIDDIPADQFSKDDVERLSEYVNLGNGVFLVGGQNSLDFGNYKGSYIETFLPVQIAKGSEKPSTDVYVVILLDRSGSTQTRHGSSGLSGVNLEKEIAMNIIDQMDPGNYVTVIAFNQEAKVLSDFVPKSGYDKLKKEIIDLYAAGSTNMQSSVEEAIKMLEDKKGSRNIIVISDGQDKFLSNYLGLIREANQEGIVTHAVNIGEGSNIRNMEEIARIGGGSFFSPENSKSVNVVFEKDDEKFPLMSPPKNHFITNDMKLKSYVTGFNQIVPKSTGQVLVTTAYGDPILVAGRYGLGRIAVLSTDDGEAWASSILKDDPKLISKIMNWAIENPERKKESYIEISDTRIGEDAKIYVKASNPPEQEGFKFTKIDENMYQADLPATVQGFNEVLGRQYAVNYHNEIENLGMNEDYLGALNAAGGKIMNPGDTRKIIENAKQASIEVRQEHISLRYYVLLAAALVFLFEITIRRIMRVRQNNN